MDQKDHQRRRLVEWLTAEITRATGRSYRIKLDALDDESLRELQRLHATSTTRSGWPCSRPGSSPGDVSTILTPPCVAAI